MKSNTQFDIKGVSYSVINTLGSGGQGEVYLVEDKKTKKKYALKYFPHVGTAKKDEIEKEVKLLQKLNHECIPSFHEYYVSKNVCMYTMDYVQGESLREITQKRLKPKIAARYISRISKIMSYVHSQGIIHKDLTPDNIILRPDDSLYVVDFGIAHDIAQEKQDLNKTFEGKWGYISPSRLQGKLPSVQDDIFSLGVIFYELLHGKTPWHVNGSRVIQFIQEESIHPDDFNKNIPQSIALSCSKMLVKQQEYRYSTMEEISKDIDYMLKSKLTKPAKNFYKSLPYAIGALLMVSSSLFVGNKLIHHPPSPPPELFSRGHCVEYVIDNAISLAAGKVTASHPLITFSKEFDTYLLYIEYQPHEAKNWYPQFSDLEKKVDTLFSSGIKKENIDSFKRFLHKKTFCSIYNSIKKNTNTLETLEDYYEMLDTYIEFVSKTDNFPNKSLITALVGMHYGHVSIVGESIGMTPSIMLTYNRFQKDLEEMEKASISNSSNSETKTIYKSIKETEFFDLGPISTIDILEYRLRNRGFLKKEKYIAKAISPDKALVDSGISSTEQIGVIHYLSANKLFDLLIENNNLDESYQTSCFFSIKSSIESSTTSSNLIDNTLYQLDLQEYLTYHTIFSSPYPSIHYELGKGDQYAKQCISILEKNKFRFDVRKKLLNYCDYLHSALLISEPPLKYIEIFLSPKKVKTMFQHCSYTLPKEFENRIFPESTTKHIKNRSVLLNHIKNYDKDKEIHKIKKVNFPLFIQSYSSIFDTTEYYLTMQNHILERTILFKNQIEKVKKTSDYTPIEEFSSTESNINTYKNIKKAFETIPDQKLITTYSAFQQKLFDQTDKQFYSAYLLNKALYLYTVEIYTSKFSSNYPLLIDVFEDALNPSRIEQHYLASDYYQKELNYFFEEFNKTKTKNITPPSNHMELGTIENIADNAYKKYRSK